MELTRLELARLIATPRSWWLLAAAAITIAWPFLADLEAAIAAQEQGVPLAASVTRLLALPVLARSALLLALLGVLLAPRWFVLERLSGLDALYRAAPVSSAGLVFARWVAGLALLLAPAVLAVAVALSVGVVGPVDYGTVLCAGLALFGLAALVQAVGLLASAGARSTLGAALLAGGVLLLFWAPDGPALARGDPASPLAAVSLTRRLHPLLQGELVLASLAFLLTSSLALLALAWARRSRRPRRLRLALAGLSLVLAVGLVAAADRIDWRVDLTAAGRHSFHPTTQEALASLAGPLSVFVAQDQGPGRRTADAFFARLARHHPALTVEYISPAKEPERWIALGLRRGGVRLALGDEQTRLEGLGELDLLAALDRLTAGRGARVAYLTGGGERDLRGDGALDWGTLGAALAERGISAVPIDTVLTPVLPEDLDLLIVAPGPRAPVPGAPEAVATWLAAGGALWWAVDPGLDPAWAPLAAALGLRQKPGVLVDARAADRGEADPRILELRRLPAHPVTAAIGDPGPAGQGAAALLLPRAAAWERAAVPAPGVPWRLAELLSSTETTWNETGPLAGALTPGGDDEARGPHWIGLALERPIAGRLQRAIVLGDGDALANRFIGRGANRRLGLAIPPWLLSRRSLAAVPGEAEAARRLEPPAGTVALLGGFWLVLVPGVLALLGLRRWRASRA